MSTKALYLIPSGIWNSETERRVCRQANDGRNVPVFGVVANRANTLAILKTAPACAPVLGQFIDDGEVGGVLGTISGDDTVFAAIDGVGAFKSLVQFLKGSGYSDIEGGGRQPKLPLHFLEGWTPRGLLRSMQKTGLRCMPLP